MCSRKTRRTFNNLFEVFSCNGCEEKYTDETFYVDGVFVTVFYLNLCPFFKETTLEKAFAPRAVIILLELILHAENGVILWLDHEPIYEHYPEIFAFGFKNIYLIVG